MKIELHSHTSEGSACALISGQELALDYVQHHMDVLVVTNHYSKHIYERFKGNLKENYLKGYLEAKMIGEQYHMTVLLGMELNLASHPNDYLIYGIDEDFICRHPKIFNESLEEAARIVHQEQGVIYQAHPMRQPCELTGAEILDGYEFNQSRFHENHNEKLKIWIHENIEKYPHLHFTCGSDCHGHEGCAAGVLEVSKDVFDNQSLKEALKMIDYPYLEKTEFFHL